MSMYIEAIKTADGYRGRVYKYDATGNRPIVVRLMPTAFERKEAAIDDAVNWCDEQDIDAEIDFS